MLTRSQLQWPDFSAGARRGLDTHKIERECQAIRRGSFESMRALSAAIERFTREWNASATPFTWVKTADEILAKAVRKPQDHSGARH